MQNKYLPQQEWNNKNLLDERDALGLPYFRRRLDSDWPMRAMTQLDMERWDAMGRNFSNEHMATGAGIGAAIAAAGTLAARPRFSRRRLQGPPRLAAPGGRGVGAEVHGAARAA